MSWKTEIPMLGMTEFFIKPEVFIHRVVPVPPAFNPLGILGVPEIKENTTFHVGLSVPIFIATGQELRLRVEGDVLVIEIVKQ